jgi:hypothetical protein
MANFGEKDERSVIPPSVIFFVSWTSDCLFVPLTWSLDFRLKDESNPNKLAVHWQKKGTNQEEEVNQFKFESNDGVQGSGTKKLTCTICCYSCWEPAAMAGRFRFTISHVYLPLPEGFELSKRFSQAMFNFLFLLF